MELTQLPASQIDWQLNFFPRRPWPALLPIVVMDSGKIALCGFERRFKRSEPDLCQPTPQTDKDPLIQALVVKSSVVQSMALKDIMKMFWKALPPFSPLEALRFSRAVGEGERVSQADLLDWPLEFQNFLDTKEIPLKSLRPLEFLRAYEVEVIAALHQVQPTASEVREILELLVDLLVGEQAEWALVAPVPSEVGKLGATGWIKRLRQLRFPQTLAADTSARFKVQEKSWPKGVRAEWRRKGDQAGVYIEVSVSGSTQWQQVRQSLNKVELEEDLWM
jgi:hypothetical protein